MNKENDENPFVAGQPARGNDFFGREEALSRVGTFFLQNNAYSLIIQGQRRSGKTSFLKRSQDKFKSPKNLILYFNLQDKINASVENFFKNIQERILKYTETQTLTQPDFKDFLISLKNSSQRKVVVLLDEFDVMCENSENVKFVSYLLEIILFLRENEIPLRFILATGRNYQHEISENCRKLEEISQKISLSLLDKDEVDSLLNVAQNLPFNENAKDAINELTAGNPFFTQALAYSVYDYAQSRNAENITLKMVKKCFATAVKSFGFGVAVIWEDLNNIDKIILFACASIIEKHEKPTLEQILTFLNDKNLKLPENIINESLNRLENNSFLKKEQDESFSFVIEFFRKWIILEIGKREINNIYKII